MSDNQIVSLYVYGVFDNLIRASNYAAYAKAMSTSGFNTVVLSTFHINPDGTLYNGLPGLMANGQFNSEGKQYPELPKRFPGIRWLKKCLIVYSSRFRPIDSNSFGILPGAIQI